MSSEISRRNSSFYIFSTKEGSPKSPRGPPPLSLDKIASPDKIPPKKHSQETIKMSPRACEVCGVMSPEVGRRLIQSGTIKVNMTVCGSERCKPIRKSSSEEGLSPVQEKV